MLSVNVNPGTTFARSAGLVTPWSRSWEPVRAVTDIATSRSLSERFSAVTMISSTEDDSAAAGGWPAASVGATSCAKTVFEHRLIVVRMAKLSNRLLST